MPGICDKILVSVGDTVKQNQPVAVIIAMKMEYVLKAPCNGTVKAINAQIGKNVAKGDIIVSFDDSDAAEATS